MEVANTDFFESIQLKEMDQVKLMNRTDKKYWFHRNLLSNILEEIQENYYLLYIKGQSLLPYETVYFDTFKNNMFRAHHNGKLNRYKIRRRTYVSSGISFLEVKFKSNKGRTIKKRISTDFETENFSSHEQHFLSEITPFSSAELKASLVNNFSRLTLVNKNFKERCTVDLNLCFKYNEKIVQLNDLVILEVKSEGGRAVDSAIQLALRNQRIKTSGFSKYCIGRTVTDRSLKRNAFKEKVRNIEKLLNTPNKIYN